MPADVCLITAIDGYVTEKALLSRQQTKTLFDLIAFPFTFLSDFNLDLDEYIDDVPFQQLSLSKYCTIRFLDAIFASICSYSFRACFNCVHTRLWHT